MVPRVAIPSPRRPSATRAFEDATHLSSHSKIWSYFLSHKPATPWDTRWHPAADTALLSGMMRHRADGSGASTRSSKAPPRSAIDRRKSHLCVRTTELPLTSWFTLASDHVR